MYILDMYIIDIQKTPHTTHGDAYVCIMHKIYTIHMPICIMYILHMYIIDMQKTPGTNHGDARPGS